MKRGVTIRYCTSICWLAGYTKDEMLEHLYKGGWLGNPGTHYFREKTATAVGYYTALGMEALKPIPKIFKERY